ncbi:MAG: hypothetical protein AAF798_05705 [Bacteroidota bacterium]
MMFIHEHIEFGKYTKHILSHKAAGVRLEVVPEVGACLTNLTLGRVAVLDAYTTPKEVDFNRWHKNLLLFPFPNRLKDGRYEWQGKEYYFAINDPVTNTALHGHGTDQPMQFLGVETSARQASIRFSFEHDGALEAYPFPFRVTVNYQLDVDRGFTTTMQAGNIGTQPIPFGLGWHPYFQIATPVDEILLQLPPCEMVGIDSHMLPTGKRYAYDEFAQAKKIGATILDNCFALVDPAPRAEVLLQHGTTQMIYWQETGLGKFNFIQLFTPPERPSIAIEPMSCNIDAFNNEDGLVVLETGEKMEASFGVQIK